MTLVGAIALRHEDPPEYTAPSAWAPRCR
jgi:hypothetical protein